MYQKKNVRDVLQEGVEQPSQKRYVQYFTSVLIDSILSHCSCSHASASSGAGTGYSRFVVFTVGLDAREQIPVPQPLQIVRIVVTSLPSIGKKYGNAASAGQLFDFQSTSCILLEEVVLLTKLSAVAAVS